MNQFIIDKLCERNLGASLLYHQNTLGIVGGQPTFPVICTLLVEGHVNGTVSPLIPLKVGCCHVLKVFPSLCCRGCTQSLIILALPATTTLICCGPLIILLLAIEGQRFLSALENLEQRS